MQIRLITILVDMGALWSPWTHWIFYSWPHWSAAAAQCASTFSLDMSKIMLCIMTINRFTGVCFPLWHKTVGIMNILL
jgi:hypothetical protein